jgi:hypothetical protein
MKAFLALCVSAIALLGLPYSGATEEPPSQAQIAAPSAVHNELERLRHDFERRREKTLEPLTGRYISSLEALQQGVPPQDRAAIAEVSDALKTARETYWQEAQGELRGMLLRATWIWRSNDDANGVVVTFHADGIVEHLGLHGRWRISGPDEVTVDPDGGGPIVLRFDDALRTFEGNRGGIFGIAMHSPWFDGAREAAADLLCSHVWSLRDDKLEFRHDGRLIQRGAGWEGRDWHMTEDGSHVSISFKNGNGGTFKFENGTLTHFDGTPFQATPRPRNY